MSRHHELHVLKFVSNYLWATSESNVLDLLELSCGVLILILLLVHEGTAEQESQMRLVILLIQHGFDLADIALIYFDNVERSLHVVEVFDNDLGSA